VSVNLEPAGASRAPQVGDRAQQTTKARPARDLIVIDTGNEPYYENRVFDPAVAARYPGGLTMVRFHELATGAGFRVTTADLIDREPVDASRAIVISEQTTEWTDQWAERGASLCAVVCFETPAFAWRFYRDLPRISARYRHAFLFAGARSRVLSPGTVFHPTLFPQPYSRPIPQAAAGWDERQFMVLINSNVVRHALRPSHVLARLRDPALRRELYSERRRAIRFFQARHGFHVYGVGWDRWKVGVSYGDYKAARRVYRGPCPYTKKLETLARYRFVVCFENTVFPGYVTEKILDCFYAGSVPVYYGAPDITDYVPRECFIDLRDFSGYAELDEFLAHVGPREFEAYRAAQARFLESPAFDAFSQESFARRLLAVAQGCAKPQTTE
jgi:alpha(1,3/1,4) fucosyltransferase